MLDSGSYGADLLNSLEASQAPIRKLTHGEVLVRQHETGSEVFVVVDGSFEAVIDHQNTIAVVAKFQPGQLFGELTAISGGPRTASVRAVGDSSIAVVARPQFMGWLDADPDRAGAVAAQARVRIDQNRAAAMLALVLGTDDQSVLDEVLPMVQWRTLEPEEVLCKEGDPSGSAYLILSGRVAVSSEQRIGSKRRVELGRNQIVGELGVLDRLPRTATVTALRRTSLAELPAAAIDRIITERPEVAIHLFRQALARALHPEPRSDQAKAVALVFTDPASSDTFRHFAESELGRHGPVAVVDAAYIDSYLGHEGVAQSSPGTVGASRVEELLHDLETSSEYLLMIGHAGASDWTTRVADTADRTLVISSAHPTSEERALIAALDETFTANRLSWWRLVMHSPSAINPAHHEREFATGDRVLHGRRDHEDDIRRATRLLSGNAIGLALGGGGARGFGHIGAYQAMLEAGIRPDVVSGTSIGSVFALAIALDWEPDHMVRFTKESFADLLDWTVPVVSFLKGERITSAIADGFGDYQCESLWRPFSAVVTNLTHSQIDLRSSGPAARAVRMSVSIPGVLPPMTENGEVFVDGGVLNNLPADVVASDPSVRTVFAIDVSPPTGPTVKSVTEPSVSGLSTLVNSARRRRSPYPSAANVVMQTMVAGSGRDRKVLMEDGTIDHYIHLNIRGSSLLAFDTVDPVISQGYESAKETLAELFPDGFASAAGKLDG